MYYPLALPKEFSIHPSPDGFCICGPHAQKAEDNYLGTISSVHLIIHKKSLCIIDTGRFDIIKNTIKECIEKHDLKLRYIILTHDHFDHVGNAQALKETFGGEIIAHILDKPLIENPLCIFDEAPKDSINTSSLLQAWKEIGLSYEKIQSNKIGTQEKFNLPLKVDRYITQNTSLSLDGLNLELIHTPGHSPGSLSVFVPSTKSVYTGDLTFWVNPCRPYPIGNAKDCVNSLNKIIDLAPSYCGHGHYKGIDNPISWLKSLLTLHQNLEKEILLHLNTPKTIQELRKIIFPVDPFDCFPLIPEGSIQAYLIYLEANHQVRRCTPNFSTEAKEDEIFWQSLK